MTEQVSREATEALHIEAWKAAHRLLCQQLLHREEGGEIALDVLAREILQAALAIERPRIEAEFAERLAGELEKRAVAVHDAPGDQSWAKGLVEAAHSCRELASGEGS